MSRKMSVGASRVIWFIMICILLPLLGYIGRNAFMDLMAKSWPTTPGIITASRGEKNRSENHSSTSRHSRTQKKSSYSYTYGVRVNYRYAVDGTTFKNDTIRFTQTNTSDLNSAKQLRRQLPVGRRVTVHYSPSNPQKATILTGIEKSYYWLIGLVTVFLLLAIDGFIRGRQMYSGRRRY